MAEQIDHDQHYSLEGQRKLRLVECVGCVKLEQQLSAMAVDLENAEVDMRVLRRKYTKAKNELAAERRESAEHADAEKIFAFWKKHCRPSARAFGDDRLKAVLGRLNEKDRKTKQPLYDGRYICEAILGAKYAPNRNRLGVPYDELALVCRDSSHLEDFHARYVAWKNR